MNFAQRGEVVIGQIVWCQLYNTGFLSFQIVINRDQWLKLTELVPSMNPLLFDIKPKARIDNFVICFW